MEEGGSQAIGLAVQLGVAAGMVLVMTIVHGLGLSAVSKVLRLKDERLEELDVGVRSMMLMAGAAMALFLLHFIEIAIFALFYIFVGALDSLEEALYFSASTYATLGRTEEFFPAAWRLLGSLEALIGFLLIGWSTAFIVSKADKLRP